jgi:hypothetical protein
VVIDAEADVGAVVSADAATEVIEAEEAGPDDGDDAEADDTAPDEAVDADPETDTAAFCVTGPRATDDPPIVETDVHMLEDAGG